MNKMRKLYILFCLILVNLFACDNLINSSFSNQNASLNDTIKGGVLIINALSIFENHDVVKLLNEDGSVFTEIKRVDNQEPSSDKLNENNILACYPEYYVIHLNSAILSDSLYSVNIGGETKFLNRDRNTEYLSWPDYLMRYYITSDKNNPLRLSPSDVAKRVENIDYSDLSFVGIEILGDWIKVQCNKECEGCGKGPIVSGWIRWRLKGKVIIKQYYVC